MTMMDVATVNEVIDCVGRLFDHIPYAVCGTAALIYYGYRAYSPDHVSITCPEESKEAIRCWALAKGMTPLPDNPDGFSVRVASGRSCPVCIKFMKNGFEQLEVVRIGPGQASMVTLPSIANTIARSYVFRLHSSSTDRQALYARYLAWTLKRMAEIPPTDPVQRLTPERARDIVNRSFWIPFTLSYPETVPLFQAAGLEIQGDGSLMDWQQPDEQSMPPPRPRARTAASRYSLNNASSNYSLNNASSNGHLRFGQGYGQNFANNYNPAFSQSQTSQTRHSYHGSDFSDSENGNTPSLRRVTKRLPSVRPMMSTFSSPSTSDSEFSHSAGAFSPQYILASPLISPTAQMPPPPPFSSFHHYPPLSPANSIPHIRPLAPPPLPRRALSNRQDTRSWT
ncbi:hypothetical protein CFAM422_011124 [Trichoderma lentiforme]|uniref:Uncharacterized protein n=1 Tax=Trichoderma lentiforme TaxID=1567552 RepID=A0A9P4X4X5_9HYPO|nr:hypothetical protein CFAM422_011124 [Trichoderma lentiforme]